MNHIWRAAVDHALLAKSDQIPKLPPGIDPACGGCAWTSSPTPATGSPTSASTYIVLSLEMLYPHVEALVAAGRIKPISPHAFYFTLLGPANGLAQIPFAQLLGRPNTAEDATRTAERLATFVLDGLLTPPRH